ncbi:22068_t:CDS:2, partial [Dentiscutata erythropus]
NVITEIDQPINNEIITQYNNILKIYVTDIFMAPEELDQAFDHDLDGLLQIVMNTHGTNRQRISAYKKIGDYLQDALLRRIPYARSFQNVMSDWIYKLPKSEFKRFQRLGKTIGAQLIKDLLEWMLGRKSFLLKEEIFV